LLGPKSKANFQTAKAISDAIPQDKTESSGKLSLRYHSLLFFRWLSWTENPKEKFMGINTRRNFFGKIAAMAALFTGAQKLFAQQAGASTSSMASGKDMPRRSGGEHHILDGIYYFSGTGSNDGYPKEDHVVVTDPFEKHVTRTMDALKKSVESAGCTMDSIIHLQVFLCLPLADSIPMPTGKARFDAHKAQYDALNKIYGTYFSPGKAPSRACMAVEWIPGDSLIEIVGSAKVINPSGTQGDK
jgi:enamine deaminase RidA (YjgF/YER057c/UK114 family)